MRYVDSGGQHVVGCRLKLQAAPTWPPGLNSCWLGAMIIVQLSASCMPAGLPGNAASRPQQTATATVLALTSGLVQFAQCSKA
jgi:hypothetical protein